MKKIISRTLIAAGIMLICIALYQKGTTTYYQKKLVKEYDEYIYSLNEKNAEDTISVSEEAENPAESLSEDMVKESENIEDDKNSQTEKKEIIFDLAKFLEDKEISGLIEIPKIRVSAAILEGTDDRALKYTVGHYPGTSQPGETGNYVLLGHRNYVYGHFFREIDKLEVGDQIIIKKDSNTYTYSVTESFVVSPEEVWVLEQSSEPIITMITCTPIGTYTDRLIVRGVLLTDNKSE